MVAVASLSRILKQLTLPRSGLSDVTGIVADTIFKKTVRLRRIVTPVRELSISKLSKFKKVSQWFVQHWFALLWTAKVSP